MDEIKQVIVIRRDLKMRRGKECAQAAHASGMWMRDRFLDIYTNSKSIYLTKEELTWLNELFTKITVQVNSEEELDDIYNKAKAANLTVHMVTDAGKTEFDGVPTKTAICIGPNKSAEIDKITKELKLY